MFLLKKNWGMILLLLLSFVILVPIFHSGSFPVHDDTQTSRVYEMAQSLATGMFPVRWVKDLGFGYGYPIFNFYAPFPYYVGAVFNLIGINALLSAKIMMATAVILAAVSMYLFAKAFLGEKGAVAAGVVYLYFPYFAVNIFVRGAVGEFYAYAILPLVFLGVFKIYEKVRDEKAFPIYWILFSAVALALVVISHNLTAFMFGIISVFVVIGFLIFAPKKKKVFVSLLLVFFLAFLLSAFYTIPALLEMRFTDVISQTSGGFLYTNHFICPAQLWDSPWGFAGSAKGCLDGLSFRLGKSNIIFATAAIILGVYLYLRGDGRLRNKLLFGFGVLLLIFSLFMSLSYSKFIWQIIPGINFVQFPWRFLDFTGVALALLTGFLVYMSELINKKIAFITFSFVIAATLLLNAKLFRPQLYDGRTAGSYISQKALTFSVSKITNEYMPKGFDRPATYRQVPKQKADIVNGRGTVKTTENNARKVTATVILSRPSVVRLNQAYFPAFRYTVNGKNLPFHIANDGIYFFLPPGPSRISANFVGTTAETISDFLSLFGILMLIAGIIVQRKYAKTS